MQNNKENKEEKIVLFKELFYRNLKQCSNYLSYDKISDKINNESKEMILPIDVNYPIKYKINKHWYRGENFLENKKILTLGCSHTFGIGIPENFIWPQVFSNKTNTEFHNLACPGDSLQGQVYKAFQYFKEFGHPKFIFGFFPYGRMELPYIPNVFGKKNNDKSSDDGKEIPIIQKIIFEGGPDIEKYSKIPHNPIEVLPKELSVFYNFMFIQILEQYCKTNNIELIWTIYSSEIIEKYIETELPEILNNYISAKPALMHLPTCYISKINNDSNIKECHKDLSNHPLFNHASDCDHSKKQNGHFSIHTHQHIAELFHKEYLKRIKEKK